MATTTKVMMRVARWSALACLALAGAHAAAQVPHLEVIERVFWRCDYAATQGRLDWGTAMQCSVATEALKIRKFGGDFSAMLAWWRERKGAEHRAVIEHHDLRLTTATGAQVADGARPALYQRFEVDKSGGWVTVSVRLDPAAWRTESPHGPRATATQWKAAIGAVKSLVIGVHCVPLVRGNSSYPCSFSLAQPALDRETPSDSAADGWWSTSDYLRQFEKRTVSAFSTPRAPALPAALKVGPEFLGLIAPAPFRDHVATSKARVLRFKVRAGSSAAADIAATFGHGLVILSPEALEPAVPAPMVSPAAPVSDRDRV